jgi:hypothetical protein
MIILKSFAIIVVCTILCNPLMARTAPESSPAFIENAGQWPSEVLYQYKQGSTVFWITKFGLVSDVVQVKQDRATADVQKLSKKGEAVAIAKHHTVKMSLVDCNTACKSSGVRQFDFPTTYMYGSAAAITAHAYQEVLLADIYNGIDMRYYTDNGGLRYDFIVHPKGDAAAIKMKFAGAENLSITADKLEYKTRFGTTSHKNLYCYQTIGGLRHKVDAAIVEDGALLGFNLTTYDRSMAVVIDPLVYSTFIGGSTGLNDFVTDMAVDASNNIYIAGSTYSTDFPTSTGAYDVTIGGGDPDAFVSKFNSDCSQLLYSTYIGGYGDERVRGLSLLPTGEVVIVGSTGSSDYPTTAGALTSTMPTQGVETGFVTKLNTSGTALIFSTYLGDKPGGSGGGVYRIYDVAIASDQSIYVCGVTSSASFHVTSTSYDNTLGGFADAFVAQLTSTGSAVTAATYIGGADVERGYRIALDANNKVFLAGTSDSPDFPTTISSGNIWTSLDDIFVAKFSADLSTIDFATVFGGGTAETLTGIVLGSNQRVYLAGTIESSVLGVAPAAFPSTVGSYDPSFEYVSQIASSESFVTALDWNTGAIANSTSLGDCSQFNLFAEDLEILASGNVAVMLNSTGGSYPTTSDAFASSMPGGGLVYLILNSNLSTMQYASYYKPVIPMCMALDAQGSPVFGCLANSSLVTSPGAFDNACAGNYDIAVLHITEHPSQIKDPQTKPVSYFITTNTSASTATLRTEVNTAVDLQFLDSRGSVVLQQMHVMTGEAIDIGMLAGGVYHVRVVSNKKVVDTIRFELAR